MFTHIVFFKLKEATNENVEKASEILNSMEGQIAELKGLEVGIDVVGVLGVGVVGAPPKVVRGCPLCPYQKDFVVLVSI